MSWVEATRGSLHARLVMTLTAGVLTVMTVSFIALHLLIRDGIYRHLDRELALRMQAVAEYAALHPGEESVAEFMPRFRARTHQDFFQIWDGQSQTLVRSDSSSGLDLPLLDAAVGMPAYFDLVLPDGHDGRAVAQVFELPPGDRRGALTVVTAEETESFNELESQIHFMLLLVAVVTTAVTLVIAGYSVRRGLRPVQDFVESLEKVNLDDPHAKIEVGPLPAELRPVAGTFSRLLDRLLQALAREQRYARNVAHELRNPIAEIRLLADIGQGSQSATEYHASMRDIAAAAGEMQRSVDTLMALTRYEAGLESPQPEPLDLCAELRRQVNAVRIAAEQRSITLRLDLPGELWIYADSALVGRLIGNVIGNAVAHSPRGAIMDVALDPDGVVRVVNPAPTLTAEDLPMLGERFYRIDSGDRASHAGLGLPLAKAIAAVLGVKLRLELREDACLVVSLRGFRALSESAGTVGQDAVR